MQNNQKVEKLIESSGLLTHHKTIQVLKESGWSVLISPYYHDTLTGKSREIDIIAEKRFTAGSRAWNDEVEVVAQLFIECKFIKDEAIFWFDSKDEKGIADKIANELGWNISKNGSIINTNYSHSRQTFDCRELHYFKNDRVVKIFSSSGTGDKDVFYKGIDQCLGSLISHEQDGRNIIFKQKYEITNKKIIRFPIISCGNYQNIFSVEIDNDGKPNHSQIKDDNTQMEINYSYLNKAGAALKTLFIIDVVNLDKLADFLLEIEKDANSMASTFNFTRDRS